MKSGGFEWVKPTGLIRVGGLGCLGMKKVQGYLECPLGLLVFNYWAWESMDVRLVVVNW